MKIELTHTFEADSRHTHAVRFVDEGRALLTGGLGGLVQRWDAEHWVRVDSFEAHEKATTGLSVGPGEVLLATTGADRTARLWSLEEKRARYTLHRRVRAEIGPDGKHLATINTRGRVTLHTLATGEELGRMPEIDRAAYALAWTPKGSAILAGGDGRIHRIHPFSGQVTAVHEGHGGKVIAIVFSASEGGFASASEEGELFLWSTAGELRRRVDTSGARPGEVAFSPDGSLIALTLAYQLQLRSAEDGALITRVTTPIKGMNGLAWSPDGRRIACAAADGKVRIWAVQPSVEI